ncbi:unnamed protein product, partial [Oppiella nova]
IKYSSGVEVNFGNELTPTQVKDQPVVDWPADNNSYYTLLMTDPDVPSRTDPKFGEGKHWIVINIPGADVSKGQTLVEYMGSGPPKGTGFHRYIFVVYKQTDIINTNEKVISKLTVEGRMQWKLKDFAKQYNLGLPIAANFYQAQFDEWVPVFMKQLGFDPDSMK